MLAAAVIAGVLLPRARREVRERREPCGPEVTQEESAARAAQTESMARGVQSGLPGAGS
jgi:hypothetical protein